MKYESRIFEAVLETTNGLEEKLETRFRHLTCYEVIALVEQSGHNCSPSTPYGWRNWKNISFRPQMFDKFCELNFIRTGEFNRNPVLKIIRK
jgi:hypothetical protein